MRSWLPAAALVCVAIVPAFTQTPNAARLHAVVAQAHRRGDFDGVVVITQHGKPVYEAALGLADRAKRTPMRSSTTFRLASLTKQVTAVLVMQQVEAGRVRLSQPVGELLPSLSATSGRVTVQQLLQHISGLPNPTSGPEDVVPPFYLKKSVDENYLQQTAQGFCSGTPVRAPDEKFEYNNCDYMVLGAMLEKVTGKRYADLLKERITGPLGLNSWGMFQGDGTKPIVARGYGSDGKTDLPQNPATYASAGGLYGNALDVAKWDTALLAHTLLSAQSTATMFHGDNNLGGEALSSWSYDVPGTSPAVHLWERQGDIGGTRLLNLILPDQEASIVIIANTEKADLFNTYSRKGLGYDLVKAFTGQ